MPPVSDPARQGGLFWLADRPAQQGVQDGPGLGSRQVAMKLPVVETDVLVVGAGPTGLMAGVVCASRGVPAVVVDRKAGPTRESRALAVQARTMEIYDQLGLADQVLAGANSAVRFQVGQTGSPGGVNIEQLQQGATRFPGIKIFEQSRNEQLLYEALAGRGGDVLWGHRLVDSPGTA